MNLLNHLIKPAYAVVQNPLITNPTEQVNNPTGYINKALQAVISIFFIVAVLYFLWYFIMSAYHMISSNGDPKKIETARDSLLNAFMGLIVVFALFAVLKFVGTILGIPALDQLQLTWPSL